MLRPRRVDRLSWHREGQPDHDHAAQALARNVNALPEARRTEKERALGFLERLEKLAALAVDALTEDEHLIQVDSLPQRRMHVSKLAV